MSPPKCGRMRERRVPCLSVNVDVMQMNALPPRAIAAPVRKSSWPPVPLIWRRPELSDATCP